MNFFYKLIAIFNALLIIKQTLNIDEEGDTFTFIF
jgi:hypothetical protein